MGEAQQWYFSRAGQTYGPFDRNQIKAMATNGQLLPNDELWMDGFGKRLAQDYKGLFPAPPPVDVFDSPPPPTSPPESTTPPKVQPSAKNTVPRKLHLERWQIYLVVWGAIILMTAINGSVLTGIAWFCMWIFVIGLLNRKKRFAYIAGSITILAVAIMAMSDGEDITYVETPAPPKATHTIRFLTDPERVDLKIVKQDDNTITRGNSGETFELLPGFYKASITASDHVGAVFSFTINKPGTVQAPKLKELAINQYNMVAQCEDWIREQLKAPRTAVFARTSEVGLPRVTVDTGVWRSYVDSQNSFGAMLRNWFTCTYDKKTNRLTTEFLTKN